MMKKNKILLFSGIIGILYFAYLLAHFFVPFPSIIPYADGIIEGVLDSILDDSYGNGTGSVVIDSVDGSLGGAFFAFLLLPHMLVVGISVIFTWVGYFLQARWCAMVSGILYIVAIFFMMPYGSYVLVQLILSFVAFGTMKKPASSSYKNPPPPPPSSPPPSSATTIGYKLNE